jgi:hypothetical protein
VPIDADNAVLSGFGSYLRRVLRDTSSSTVAIEEHARGFGADTLVDVVPGELTAWDVRRIRRKTALMQQFSGGSWLGPGALEHVDVSIFDGWDRSRVDPRPASFDVLAIVSTYNEADVIGGLLGRLVSQGVRVHVIDNWSDDSTIEIVSAAALGEAVTFERFPADGAVAHYEWERLLGRVEEVAHGSGADWVIHHDADEIRESPWSGVDLAMGLWMVEQWGFNCVDHTVVNFRPIDGSWGSGGDLATAFAWCELGSSPGHFTQLKAWKPQVGRATLAARGGARSRLRGTPRLPVQVRQPSLSDQVSSPR